MWARSLEAGGYRSEARAHLPRWRASELLSIPTFNFQIRTAMWCRGQDSNLRSPSGRRFYRPLVLATHPPRRCPGGRKLNALHLPQPRRQLPTPVLLPPTWSPRGDSNPPTYRLQVGCATIAPLGLAPRWFNGTNQGTQQKDAPPREHP